MRTFNSAADLITSVGEELGVSDWLTIDQSRVNRFAEATDDYQWIHVDPARAANGPYGGTIAHGFLTLSLIPALVGQIYEIPTATMRVNYGLDRVRFINPVRVGHRVRLASTLTGVAEIPGGTQLTLKHLVEIEDVAKPACVAEMIGRVHFA